MIVETVNPSASRKAKNLFPLVSVCVHSVVTFSMPNYVDIYYVKYVCEIKNITIKEKNKYML